MSGSVLGRFRFALAIAAVLTCHGAARAQYGVVLSGAGPVDRSMGGASTAAPLDASGAMYWNPATITALCGSEMDVGLEVLYPQAKLSSGVEFLSLNGTTRSDNGVFLLPTMALAYQPECSPWAFGLGVFSAGGFAVNYAGSTTNPILTPQPPHGLGLGPIDAELQVYQVVPTAAFRLTDRLSIGIAPTLSFAHLVVDPAVLTPPDADGYPPATNGRLEAGGGVQAGIFYSTESFWNFGASIKSPQWFENFRYNTIDSTGPHSVQLHFNYPLMASLGTSYTGFERWILAADVHYIDYRNTEGFEQSGFDPTTGALKGLGWDSVFAVALGAQYELTPCTTLRIGYTYNTNPIRDDRASYNVASPTILENTIYCGASYKITEQFIISAAYAHAFENSVQGPIITPTGPVPTSFVQSNVSADTVIIGATVKF